MSFDGDYISVKRALLWTIDELLIGEEEDSTLYCDFEEKTTFELYQDPEIGWITKDPLKLGGRAQKITFHYCHETIPPSIELTGYEGSAALSLTAIKTVIAVRKLLSECKDFYEDLPCAQPLSLSDWNFPKIAGFVRKESLREFHKEAGIERLWEYISPTNRAAAFAIGRTHHSECGFAPNVRKISPGDIVIVKRRNKAPSFGKISHINEGTLTIALKFTSEGNLKEWKEIPSDHISQNIFCHWTAPDSETGRGIKRKRKDD